MTDGLVNGARGKVVHFVKNSSNVVSTILVKFDNPNVGKTAIQSSPYRSNYENAVPLSKYEATFLVMGKRGSQVKRMQFPLTLAWSTTIHKVQGLTLDEIVVDMENSKRFNAGQAYVAFSRVKSLKGLHVFNFQSDAIKCSPKVSKEMAQLGTKLVSSVPIAQCHQLKKSHITFALLNVRCLLAKLADIHADINIQNADVVKHGYHHRQSYI